MEKLSVIIITNNEEKNIKDCLQSVSFANEIILVDSGSEDKTLEIAEEFTNKIYKKDWEGFAKQKAYALSLANNEWVLSVDADERVNEKLKEEILNLSSKEFDGYFIPRKNYFFKKEINCCGWNNDKQLRLFKKIKTTLTDRLVHEGFKVDGKVGELKNELHHYTFTSLTKYIEKINNYTTLQALENFKNKNTVKSSTLVTHTFSAFLRYYISLKGYRDGIHGLIISFFHSLSTLLTYVKIWELQRKENN